jgi:hypothetical protein
MAANSEVSVTLSRKLHSHLCGRAADLEVPLEWLVAGLVCDTVESVANVHPTRPEAMSRRAGPEFHSVACCYS